MSDNEWEPIRKVLWKIGIADLIILAIGVASLQISAHNKRNAFGGIGGSGIALAFSAIGLVTFFGCLHASRHVTQPHEMERRIRLSITVAFMAVYFAVLGTLIFYVHVADTNSTFPFATTVLTNFTALMVVIIGFFFGSSAYAEKRQQDGSSSRHDSQAGTVSPRKPDARAPGNEQLAKELIPPP